MPVLALDSTRVWRVKTSYFGYGKALYLMSPHGHLYVYGHLSRFAPHLEDWIWNEQMQRRTYFLDLYPMQDHFFLPGQEVALSGATGAGPPHLHFEVRTEDNRPVNPLFFLPIPDHRAPVFEGLRIVCRSPLTLVNREPLDLEPPLEQVSRTLWRAEDLDITGPFGLEVQVADSIDRSHYRISPYELLGLVDGDTFFWVVHDTLPFSNNSVAVVEYRRDPWGRRWHRLYAPGNWYHRPIRRARAALDLPDGEHHLEIVARDIRGNTARLVLTVYTGTYGRDPFEAPATFDFESLYLDSLMAVGFLPNAVIVETPDSVTLHLGHGTLPLMPSDLSATQDLYVLTRQGVYQVGPRKLWVFFADPAGDTLHFGSWTLRIPEGALAERTPFVAFETPAPPLPELVPQGTALRLLARDPVFLHAAYLAHQDTLPVYWVNEDRGRASLLQEGALRGTGLFASYADTLPPRVRWLSRRRILARLEDQGSGIDARTLEVRVDGDWIPAYYDIDRHRVTYEHPLPPGRHRVSLTVADKAGRRTTSEHTLQVR